MIWVKAYDNPYYGCHPKDDVMGDNTIYVGVVEKDHIEVWFEFLIDHEVIADYGVVDVTLTPTINMKKVEFIYYSSYVERTIYNIAANSTVATSVMIGSDIESNYIKAIEYNGMYRLQWHPTGYNFYAFKIKLYPVDVNSISGPNFKIADIQLKMSIWDKE